MQVRAYLGVRRGNELQACETKLDHFARGKGHRVLEFYRDEHYLAQPVRRPRLFALLHQKGLAIASRDSASSENARQPALSRPELFRLLEKSRPGDVFLLQEIKALASLNDIEWSKFRRTLKDRKVRLVAMDVEASNELMFQETTTVPMVEAINAALLDMVDVMVRKPHRETRHRQLEGIAKARSQGKYRGRPVDINKHERILRLLQDGLSWSDVCKTTGVSRSTIARVVKANNDTAKAG